MKGFIEHPSLLPLDKPIPPTEAFGEALTALILDSRKGAISTGATVGPDGLVWSVVSRPVLTYLADTVLSVFLLSLVSCHTSRHVTSRLFSACLVLSFLVTRVFFLTVKRISRVEKKARKKKTHSKMAVGCLRRCILPSSFYFSLYEPFIEFRVRIIAYERQ